MKEINAYLLSAFIMMIVFLLPYDTMKSVNSPWYQKIKPSITPPKWVFPVVWTTLYIIIGYALAKTLMLPESDNKKYLLYLFAINLILNVAWSFVFFGNKDIITAFIITIGLILSQIYILKYAYKVLSKNVYYSLIPYLLWLCFAAILNYLSIQKI